MIRRNVTRCRQWSIGSVKRNGFSGDAAWDLTPGETVALKLQVRSVHGIRHLSWQGDTQALSLTAGTDTRSTEGWTIIMPPGISAKARQIAGVYRWWLRMKKVSVSLPMRSRSAD
ncbi:invasin [Salmonella enterica subsp. enterica]|uniref:Invasin n=1 Tax=Salmonella enterica I TaxID=59201 RepID=A0A379WSM8_SALET|nr:invasin [Salmonella enterica subsp. enterica]